jgi:hypothetical protein
MISSIETLRADNSPAPPTLVESIEQMIDRRDKIWRDVMEAEHPAMRDLNTLRTTNEALEPMLHLTDGPTTKVLSPARNRIERLRSQLCRIFITRVELEITAAQRDDSIEPARRAASAFLASSYACIFILVLFVLSVASASAQTVELSVKPTPTPSDFTLRIPTVTKLSIQCGNGWIEISTKTGNVQFTGDCNPDDASRIFWKTVERTYPSLFPK